MNRLKHRLLSGEFVTAAWVELGSPDNAEAMVRNGWDTILIDGEHGIGDLEQWTAVARAVEAAGGEPLLRVPNAQQWMLNKILDRGFRSLIVPRVNTPAEAQAVADACFYPPRGTRGYAAPIVRASSFGARPGYALKEAHEELLLMVQCEDVAAVDSIAAIAGISGIDAIFIGPNDLAGSVDRLERLFDETPQSLIEKVEMECKRQGRMLATIVGARGDWSQLKSRGYNFVAGPSDVSLIASAARQAIAERDAALGKSATTEPLATY